MEITYRLDQFEGPLDLLLTLIHKNKVIAGTSAKKAETKIESVKRALFSMPGQAEEVESRQSD